MTTNVFDQPARVLATDSRWSVQWGDWLLYVDDANYDKIELYGSTAFMFAGKGLGVQQWKNWIRTSPTSEAHMPQCEGVAVCVVDTTDGNVLFGLKQEIVQNGGYFAGSGARIAYMCWDKNKNARKCVDTAKAVDHCTGGEVKYYDCSTREHNLSYPTADVTIDMVNQAVQTRGMAMQLTKTGSAPFKLKELPGATAELAGADPQLLEAQAKLQSGELSVEAPCDQMYNSWTDDEKNKLKGVLAGVFGWKN